MPVFDFLASFIHNFGWVIALLTLFIRLVTSPLTYTSYLSGAKMKVLRPELAELKKKHGDNQQAYAMDQMKIFREAGVNPLGGCIPALLQIPIFFENGLTLFHDHRPYPFRQSLRKLEQVYLPLGVLKEMLQAIEMVRPKLKEFQLHLSS